MIRKGEAAQVIWSTANTSSCTVSANNPTGDSWTGLADTKTSSPIVQRTTYTLSCIGLDGSTLTKSATVSILPVFQEL